MNNLISGILYSMTKISGITDPDKYGITPLDRWGTQLGLFTGSSLGALGSVYGLGKAVRSGALPMVAALPLGMAGILGGAFLGGTLGNAAKKQWGDPAGHHVAFEGGLDRYAKSLGKKTSQMRPEDVRNAVAEARSFYQKNHYFPSAIENMAYVYGKDPKKITAKEMTEFQSDDEQDRLVAKGIDYLLP